MRVFRMMLDKDKETAWLNEMADKGHAMTGFCAGFYYFEDCQPGEYLYQVDFTDGLFRVSQDYRQFMTEMGVEVVALWGFWVVLRRKAAEGEFTLYTDVETMIEHYRKIRRMFKVVAVVEMLCLIMEIYGAYAGSKAAIGGMLVIGIMTWAVIRQAIRTNDILDELYARQGRVPEGNGCRSRKVPMVLAAMLLLNGIAFLCRDLPEPGPVIGRGLHVLAIILMALCVWQCFRGRGDDLEG